MDEAESSADLDENAAKSNLARAFEHLQSLQVSEQRAKATITRAEAAYAESIELLRRIDGAAESPLISRISIPE